MKKIRIVRVASGKNSTLSHLYIDDCFICFLLEDKISKVKAAGLTCIPEGNYRLTINTLAPMNMKYAKRFPKIHQGMLEITGISNFKGVFIHIGNYFKDTKGCPLTGIEWLNTGEDYQVHQSAFAYVNMYQILMELLTIQQRCEVIVVNDISDKGGFYGV